MNSRFEPQPCLSTTGLFLTAWNRSKGAIIMSRINLVVNRVPIVFGWDNVLRTFFFQAQFDDQGVPAIDSGTEFQELSTIAALESRFTAIMGMPAPNFAREIQLTFALTSTSKRTRAVTT
jgi:hypothetical protein